MHAITGSEPYAIDPTATLFSVKKYKIIIFPINFLDN